MIDDAFLSGLEGYTGSIGNTHAAEIIRNARRYLALRDAGVLIVGGQQMSEYAHGPTLDAAADRLLEECSSQAQNGVGNEQH